MLKVAVLVALHTLHPGQLVRIKDQNPQRQDGFQGMWAEVRSISDDGVTAIMRHDGTQDVVFLRNDEVEAIERGGRPVGVKR